MGAQGQNTVSMGRGVRVMRGYRDIAVSVGRFVRAFNRMVPQKTFDTVDPLIPTQVEALYHKSRVLVYPEDMPDTHAWEAEAAIVRIQAENRAASEVRITDADVALELTHFIRAQFLAQSHVMHLVQPCNTSHMALALVGG